MKPSALEYAIMLNSNVFGHWTEHGGPWCLHSAERDREDESDAVYWESIGFNKLAADRRERRRQRRILMGWPAERKE